MKNQFFDVWREYAAQFAFALERGNTYCHLLETQAEPGILLKKKKKWLQLADKTQNRLQECLERANRQKALNEMQTAFYENQLQLVLKMQIDLETRAYKVRKAKA